MTGIYMSRAYKMTKPILATREYIFYT